MSYTKKERLDRLYEKYKVHETLFITKSARKTIRYIEKNTINFPKDYKVLRDRIINTSYSMLENIYRANIFQEKDIKKEVIVNIEMLKFYLEEALSKGLITYKKFESYVNHLIEIDKMTRAWFNYEKSE